MNISKAGREMSSGCQAVMGPFEIWVIYGERQWALLGGLPQQDLATQKLGGIVQDWQSITEMRDQEIQDGQTRQ